MTTTPLETRTYFAISILSSRTFWLNLAALFIAVCSATEVIAIVPARFLPIYSALLAVVNIALRLNTVRPAALIAPGTTKAIAVPKIDTPPPTLPLVTD